MNKLAAITLMIACAEVATPQGRPVDWPSIGGDARRTGWEKSDIRITKDNVKDFQLVLKRKLEGPKAGSYAVTPPVVIGLLISYKGFKELGFIATNSGDFWSIDLDTDRVFWKKKFDVPAKPGSAACAEMASAPALVPPAVFGRRPGGPRPAPGTARPTLPARLGGGGFGGARPIYVVFGDGKLHQVNTSDGSDAFPPLEFLPANAKPAGGLLMTDNTVYAMTGSTCGGAPNAMWALDLSAENPVAVHSPLSGTGTGAFAVGNDGTVYAQTDTLQALSSKELKPKGQFKAPAAAATPVVFEFKGVDLIVSAGKDGRLNLLDSRNLGDTPVAQTPPITSAGGSIFGGLASWEDSEGVRWVAAPVWGALNSTMKGLASNGAAPNGSIVAFRIEDEDGKPAFVPGWVSRDMKSPVAPVTTSGIVFGLSTKGSAQLVAFDAATGKELYSTGNQVSAPGSLTGLTVANGRVFFSTTDNTLYGFGIFLER